MRHLIIFTVLLLLEGTSGAEPGLRSLHFHSAQSKRFLTYPEQHVVIINDLPFDADLTVHCKSKDDDLGVQLLRPQGRFQFHFYPSFWRNTLFFCSFKWTGGFHYYDIYVQKRDVDRCAACMWSIVPDGPCLFNPVDAKYDICDRWNPPSLS
ncbi:hypothetical protein CDL15_Pgr021045 [Punica granatum]|uniref:S-protein homolog n=1 Tax=Punica granatum TaxID=22663 RepID=A0A218Y0Z8_PUNGR|nr:hypothetical protein CDL15_Pgr021045 [Punica granatum]